MLERTDNIIRNERRELRGFVVARDVVGDGDSQIRIAAGIVADGSHTSIRGLYVK